MLSNYRPGVLSFAGFVAALLICFSSCSKDTVHPPPDVAVDEGPVKGFFLLNEANMGSYKSSIDYYDYTSGDYLKNIYPQRNPTITQSLGDVGNDIQIYGNKLYAIINVSGKVVVMDVNTAGQIAVINIPNCRYITFDKGFAYVSSYAGPVLIDPNAGLGYIAKIDTSSFNVVDTCLVGYQPEEMVIRDNKLYVANSGGYRVPNYDNTVSVIDLNSFKEIKKITVAINLHRLELDHHGNIYVSSRGDYRNIPSNLYVINANDLVSANLKLPAGNMTLSGDSLYVYSTGWSNISGGNKVTYAIVNTRTREVVSSNFITDGTDKLIAIPYGIAINPDTREILVTDAKDYVTSGTLYCFSPAGKLKWQFTAGNIPAHIVFTRKRLINP